MTASPSSDLTLHLALFSHVACRPESEIDLGQAALLIAEPEYEDLDVAVYLRTLDRLADQVRPRLGGSGEHAAKATALLGFLLQDEGFRGNTTEYKVPPSRPQSRTFRTNRASVEEYFCPRPERRDYRAGGHGPRNLLHSG